jgi:dTDP-4-amino-4,6-dideoxygalactose transaminase
VIPFVDLRPAVESIRSDIDSAIKRTVDRGIFLNGPEVEAFEEAWSRYVGV